MLLLAGAHADTAGVCNSIEEIVDRRDTEMVRSVVGFASSLVVVVPFLPFALGTNSLIRSHTTDARFARVASHFETLPDFQGFIETRCGLRTSVRYLQHGARAASPLAITAVVLGSLELAALAVLGVALLMSLLMTCARRARRTEGLP